MFLFCCMSAEFSSIYCLKTKVCSCMDVDNAQLYTLSGMLLNSVENASSIEKPINKGVYILNITINGNTTIHKIII